MSNEYETWKAYAENLQAQRENDAASIDELAEALDRQTARLIEREAELQEAQTERDHFRAVLDGAQAGDVPVKPVAFMVRNPRTAKVRLYQGSKAYLIESWELVGYEVTPLFACAALATQPAAGEQVAIKLPPAPYVGPEGGYEFSSYEQGELQGRCDMWELIRKMNTPPAAAHGDEAVQIKLPEFILCSDEMHERGKHAVERAIEDQCFGRWTQFKVYFEAAIGEWLSQQGDAAMRAQEER